MAHSSLSGGSDGSPLGDCSELLLFIGAQFANTDTGVKYHPPQTSDVTLKASQTMGMPDENYLKECKFSATILLLVR